MNRVELFYKKVIKITCDVCGVDPIMLFSCNKEKFVDARSLAIINLSSKGFTDSAISELTGLTRQSINYIRNNFPDKYNRSWALITCQQQISKKLAEEEQGDF